METAVGFKGLKELQSDIEKILADYPDETDRMMRRSANGFVKDCNAKMPGRYQSGKRSIPRSWKKEYSQELAVKTDVKIRNTAPHFHLVENGHRRYDFHGNPTGGFVAGKHYAEKTRKEWEEKFPEIVSEEINKLLKKGNL